MRALLPGSCLLLAPAILLGQTLPMATLTGRVADANGTALAGVRVLATSTNLQGDRSVTTSNEGLYCLALLPSGDYTVEFSRDGLATVSRPVSLAAAAGVRIDIVMSPATVHDTATVTGETSWQQPLDLTQVGVNYSQGLANELPLDRTLRSIALLAPGVTNNGPASPIGSANVRPALMISGAPSYD